MRTTVDLDDEKLDRVSAYAPRLTRNALIDAAFDAFIRQEAGRRIAEGALYQPTFKAPPRRKMS